MKTKKAKNADVDRLRSLFFKIGLGVSLLIIIASFNWTIYDSEIMMIEPLDDFNDEEEWADIVHIKKEIKMPEYVEIIPVNKEVDPNKKLLDLLNQDNKESDSVGLKHIEEKKEVVEEEVFEFYAVEKKPSFPGGESALFKFLSENLKYPEIEYNLGIYGKVSVGFNINTDGTLSDFDVIKGVTPNLDEEAIRVLKLMPCWVPGYQREKSVKVRCIIPIRFTIVK